MRLGALLICLLVLAAGVVANHVVAFSPDPPPGITLLYTSAARYDGLAWMRGGERFPRGAVLMVNDGKTVRPLTPGFSATADPSVGFDGKAVLFAGKKKSSDRWQIWEIGLEGGDARLVVSSQEDVVRPMYLPEKRVVYARRIRGQFVIETAPVDGGEPLRITYAPGSALPTDVLHDGRILFEAGYPLGSNATPELYTVYSDGSGVESYRCDHGQPRHSGKQVASGDVVFTRGQKLARFTSALAHEIEIGAPPGEYSGDVAETTGGWIISRRASAGHRFELARWNPSVAKMEPLASDAGRDLVQPTIVAARPIPNRHPSALHPWKVANLLTLNAYTSKYAFAEGAIAAVRLYTPDAAGKPRLLGTAPVEKDGSLYIQVPGDKPLKFELLDATGKTLKKQDGWMWTRAGEQRICVGCHAGPERAPDNAMPAILQRSTTPADLTGASPKGGH